MRILFVTNQMEIGGIETNLVRLTRHLVARGHDVTVAARPGRLSQAVTDAGGRRVDLEVVARRPAAVLRDVRRLRALVRTTRPDVVHVFSAASALLVWPVRPGRPPVVGSIMGLDQFPGEPQRKVLLRSWLTALGVRRLVIMAPAIDAVVRRLPIRRARLVHRSVVGIDLPALPTPDERLAARTELGLGPDDRLVVTVGRLDVRKSHELFLRAAAAVLDHRDDTRFWVAGDGDRHDELTAEIARLGVASHVRLLGSRDDVTRLLTAADVCVKPGVVEGFIGITVLEAQAVGTPVVAFDTADVRLAVTPGETGLIVPVPDVAALAAAIERLLDHPAEAAAMAATARERLEVTYAMPVVTDGLLALYRSLLEPATSSG